MKRPKNPTKVITGIGTLGGDGDCGCLFVEEYTVDIVDGNRKEKLTDQSQDRSTSLYFDDIFPTPYKKGQDSFEKERFRFRIEVEIEVLK